MSTADKRASVAPLKQDGDALFKAGRVVAAAQKYERALACIEGVRVSEGTYPAALQPVRTALLLNLAACLLQTDPAAATAHCTEGAMHARVACLPRPAVLAMDPANVKALFRRGRACVQRGRHEEGLADLTRAQQLAPHDAAIATALADARTALAAARRTSRDLCARMLGVPASAVVWVC